MAPASAFEMPCGSADERPTCLDFAEDLKPTNAALPVLVPQCQRHPPLPPLRTRCRTRTAGAPRWRARADRPISDIMVHVRGGGRRSVDDLVTLNMAHEKVDLEQ